MRAGRELRRIVIARIIDQVPELGGRVYDRAVKATEYPYAALGPSSWTDDSADCIDGRLYSLQIDIWHGPASKGEVEDITDDVAACLKDWADDTVVSMHPFGIDLVRVMDDPSGNYHGVVQIEAIVEES